MHVLPVNSIDDVAPIRRATRELARQVGFSDTAIAELDVVVSELATNLAVHQTVDGEILVSRVIDNLGKGIEVVSRDRGPGIADVQFALQNHNSTGGSLGCGLGAVRRLMDEFDVYSHVQSALWESGYTSSVPYGTIVTTRKWLRAQTPGRFVYSVNSRPFPGEIANGDGWIVTEERDGLFVAVADGLGHGPEAEKASRTALEYLNANNRMEFGRLLLELHGVLKKTRGVALTLVRISHSERNLIHSGIGNVQTRVYPRSESSLVVRPGVLGAGAPPRPMVNKIPWPRNATLVVYSDGISSRWDLDEIPGLRDQHVTTLSHLLMHEHARSRDDATVVVAKEIAG